MEDLSHLGSTEGLLDQRGLELAQHERPDLVYGLVNNIVELNLDFLCLGQRSRFALRSDIEPDDLALGSNGEIDVGFRDSADTGMQNLNLDFVRRQLLQRLGKRFDRGLRLGL